MRAARNGVPKKHRSGAFRPALALCCALALAAALCGCDDAGGPAYAPRYADAPPAGADRVYVFAPHPLMNPQKLARAYGALLDRMNSRLRPAHIRLRLEASRDYADFNAKLRERSVDFALPNPYQTVLSQDCGYVIFGKMSRDSDFCGIILIRRTAPLATVRSLAGARVSFPAPTALAATLMPQLYLREHGLDPLRDIAARFVGTHDSALLNVCTGVSDAACTWPIAWRAFQSERPDMAHRLQVRWRTPTLPNNGLVALASVPVDVRRRVAQAFFALADDAEGRELLDRAGVERFVPADNATFAPVYDFINRYNRQVRRLKGLNE